jgi:hypothetical protein
MPLTFALTPGKSFLLSFLKRKTADSDTFLGSTDNIVHLRSTPCQQRLMPVSGHSQRLCQHKADIEFA